ncbi:hypothetical protein [Lacticaseibacillus jixiensis]|uniref:hypothetical protein n=1 Tax=Lacticaseibacillus jixiensis TaxID=3231926 RepID=UPI0036F2FE2C
MKKIKDERLIVRNLRNIRLAFIAENVFIIGALILQIVRGNNLMAIVSYHNPLFSALMVGGYVLVVLSVNVSVPIYDTPKKSLQQLLTVALLVWLASSAIFFWFILPASYWWLSLVCGAIISVVVTSILLYANHVQNNG